MQTDIGRVAKIWPIMMWLIVLSPIIVILFVKLETPLTGRGDLTVILICLGYFIAIPLILIGIALICVRRLSKSRLALLYYPVIGGLAFLISVVAEQHSAKDTPPGDSKEKS